MQTNYQSTVRLLTRAALIARQNLGEQTPCIARPKVVCIGVGIGLFRVRKA